MRAFTRTRKSRWAVRRRAGTARYSIVACVRSTIGGRRKAEPEGWKVLILRAYRNWDFPKGLIDPGEDPFAAAKREVEEEAALTVLEFPFGEVYRETAREVLTERP